MNRSYEELFILKPDTPEEEADAYLGQIKDLITNGKGTIEKADKWGVRKLAYRVQKYAEGLFILIVFTAPADLVKEVERRMRNTDLVIKFITVRVDERMKKIDKRKKAREKRAARKPPPPQMSAPSAPLAPAMPAPAAPAAHPAPAVPAPAPAEPVAVAPVEAKTEAKEPVTE
ncbi:MAG TPA: 30S ribosomal protein S6 [Bryobacteraceae bacterium]|jgi:small subunit ribosomal protein S6